MSILVLALALTTLQATPPQASDGPTTTLPTVLVEAPAAPARERVICRRERLIGSNLPQRTCKTAREWEAESDQSRQDFERARGTSAPENIDPTRRD